MDCLRLEWSPVMAETIICLYDCVREYRTPPCPSAPPAEAPDIPFNISVNVALSHINLFLIVNDSMCLMTRIDAVTLEKTMQKSGAVISGVKVVDVVPYTGELTCKTYTCYVKSDQNIQKKGNVFLLRAHHSFFLDLTILTFIY